MAIHFIGIGGIGVSALAKYFLHQGAEISGSDLSRSEITEELKRLGAKIFTGEHQRTNLPQNTQKVIYTPAISTDNPELKEANLRHLQIQSYPEAVGELTKIYKTITVSGAHGKSTTAALTALALEDYLDPIVIVGAKIKEFGDSNFRMGRGGYLVLEADEWNKSFLNYYPQVAVVTNLDCEHLDTYKSFEAIKSTFKEYLAKVPQNGIIVANADDKDLLKLAKKFGKKVVWYSLKDKEALKIRKIIRLIGEHNVSNALAALKTARALGTPEWLTLSAIARFGGVGRRFEFKGLVNDAFLFDDYAHHPREIAATIRAARKRFPFRRVWCVFQPHQYQRFGYLWEDFKSAFDGADRICLLPVYKVAGREKGGEEVNSLKLAQELVRRGKRACYFDTFAEAEDYIRSEVRGGDIVIVMGAGDIYKLSQRLIEFRNF